MDLDLFEFLGRQLAWLGNNLLGYGQLADVVQERGRPQGLHLGGRQSQVFGDFHGINTNTSEMIVSRVVLGFNGQCQRFDSAQMQRGHFFHVDFLVLQTAQISAVRTIDEVNDRDQHQGSVPVGLAAQYAKNPCDGSAAQIVWEAPEVTVVPDAS